MPFTDPMADGPAIQAANIRSLDAGTTNRRYPGGSPKDFRARHPDVPLVLMGYGNPMLRRGADWFAAACAEDAGVDGVICVDVPPEEDDALGPQLRAAGHRADPARDPHHRLRALARRCSMARAGFVYYVSVAGITGKQQAQQTTSIDAGGRAAEGGDRPARSRSASASAPPNRPPQVARVADGVVVGSAIVEIVASARRRFPRPRSPSISRTLAEAVARAQGKVSRMSWLSNVRNALPFVAKKASTSEENLWHKCKGCGQMVFVKELEENLYVCPKCDHHERIGPTVTLRPGLRRRRVPSCCRRRKRARGPAEVPRLQDAMPTGSGPRAPRPPNRMRSSTRAARSAATARSSACRISRSWADRWAWRSAKRSCAAWRTRSRTACPM